MDPEKGTPVVYCAFNSKGTKILPGPFKTRAEAKPYLKKVGMACRFCGRYSGGNRVSYGCLIRCFENRGKEKGK
jgi:hypothetical protein